MERLLVVGGRLLGVWRERLLEKERIAAGESHQPVDQVLIGTLHAGESANVVADVLPLQWSDPEQQVALPPPLGDQLTEWSLVLPLLLDGKDHHRPPSPHLPQKVDQEIQCALVGCVQVLHHEEQALGRGDAEQHPPERLVDPFHARAAKRRALQHRLPDPAEKGPNERHRVQEVGRGDDERTADPVGAASQILAKRFLDRQQRLSATAEALDAQHPDALLVRLLGYLGGEPALADTGFPYQEHGLSRASPQLGQILAKLVELAFAIDERLVHDEGSVSRVALIFLPTVPGLAQLTPHVRLVTV